MFPFNSSSESARRVSPGQLQALLSIYQQDARTGMVHLSSPQNKNDFFVLLYVDGQAIRFYQHQSKGYVRHDMLAKNSILPKSELDLQEYEFSARFIRPLQGIFEQTKIEQPVKISTQSILDIIQKLEKGSEPVVAHFHWPSAEGFSLIPGNGLPSRQSMFWSQNQPSVMPNFIRWPEPECTLTTYSGNAESNAWHENYLMLGFDFLYEQIFSRYDELVGASMVTRLENQLNAVARLQGWKISFSGRILDDTQFFSSAGDMRIAYRTLLLTGQQHISSVVGERLFEESLLIAIGALPSILRSTLQVNNILTYRIQ